MRSDDGGSVGIPCGVIDGCCSSNSTPARIGSVTVITVKPLTDFNSTGHASL